MTALLLSALKVGKKYDGIGLRVERLAGEFTAGRNVAHSAFQTQYGLRFPGRWVILILFLGWVVNGRLRIEDIELSIRLT